MEYDLDNSGDIGKSQKSHVKSVLYIFSMLSFFLKRKGHSKYVIKTEFFFLHLH